MSSPRGALPAALPSVSVVVGDAAAGAGAGGAGVSAAAGAGVSGPTSPGGGAGDDLWGRDEAA